MTDAYTLYLLISACMSSTLHIITTPADIIMARRIITVFNVALAAIMFLELPHVYALKFSLAVLFPTVVFIACNIVAKYFNNVPAGKFS